MNCRRCFSNNYVKNGSAKGRPRFKCKDCNYRYTVAHKSTTKPPAIRRLALEMYLEGLGFRHIGMVLKISYVTVYNWVKKWGASVELPVREDAIDVVELDEMHTYVGKKNYRWIWIAVDRYGKNISLLSVGTDLLRRD